MRQKETMWEDLIGAYHNARSMFQTPMIYAQKSKEIGPHLDVKTRTDLTNLLKTLEHDMRTFDARIEVIRAMHTNKLGQPYAGKVNTDTADFKYLEIGSAYAGWNEEFNAVLSQSMVDISNILNYAQPATGVSHVHSQ